MNLPEFVVFSCSSVAGVAGHMLLHSMELSASLRLQDHTILVMRFECKEVRLAT